MRYIIFTRVSTNLQETDNQIWECRNYIDSIKQTNDQVFEFDEKANSTRKEIEERPVIQEMLKFLNRGDTLVVYKLNRLARGHEMAMLFHLITKKKKAKLISLYEKEITDELIHAYALVAAAERKNISQNTSTALRRKSQSLEKVGTTLYGYKTDETRLQTREKVRSSNKPYLLIPEEHEQIQVNLMVDLYKSGHSFGEIEREMALRGYKNREGNPVHKMTIHRILTRLKHHIPIPIDVKSTRFEKCKQSSSALDGII